MRPSDVSASQKLPQDLDVQYLFAPMDDGMAVGTQRNKVARAVHHTLPFGFSQRRAMVEVHETLPAGTIPLAEVQTATLADQSAAQSAPIGFGSTAGGGIAFADVARDLTFGTLETRG